MSLPNQRRALQLLPASATTAVGSLPHTQLELGIQAAFQVDIPWLPQLPVAKPSEFMIPAAIEGLPGLRFDDEGMCEVDRAVWEKEGPAFEGRLEAALAAGDLSAYEPSPLACRAFRPFLWEVEHRKLVLAKAQLAGPFTVRQLVKSSEGESVSRIPSLDRAIYRLLLARSLAMVSALRRAGATPIFFLDEPGLYAYERTDPRHLMALQELRLMVVALQRQGAWVGLHCCSNTAWGELLESGLDLLSLDVRLSLDALLEHPAAVSRFLGSGARLSLGLIPTDLATSYRVVDLVDSVEASLRAALPDHPFEQGVRHTLFTPACGLAMRSVQDTERIFDELKQGQRLLRARSQDLPAS